MSSNCRDLRKQNGAALIIALVVVLLVVMLATRISSDYLVLFRSVENQAGLQQARAYLRGAELVAQQALLRDLQAGTDLDSMLEPWAQPVQLPVPEGLLKACLADLQARLNLNDLGTGAGDYSPAQKRFIRLLQALELDAPPDSVAALALANAVFDWVDADNEPRYPGGAEALDYLQLPQAYRPANQAFASVTELRLIKGFTPALVAALTPHVGVWGNGNINLNTLDAQLTRAAAGAAATDFFPDADGAVPVLLRILNNAASLVPLSVDGARLLAAARSNSGGVLQDLELFRSGPFAAQDWELAGLALNSDFFELRAVMQAGSREYVMTSVLRRGVTPAGVPQIVVMSRRFGGLAETGESACAAALP